MTYRVSLTRRAEQDRDAAFEWYAANYSEAFAVRWYNGITRAIRSLARSPLRCQKAPENHRFTFDAYQLIHGRRQNKHRVPFAIHGDLVLVLHIRHAARRDLTEDDLL